MELFPGHIACDGASRSEIVVPVVKDGKVRFDFFSIVFVFASGLPRGRFLFCLFSDFFSFFLHSYYFLMIVFSAFFISFFSKKN